MDVSTIYVSSAVEALAPATRGHDGYSPLTDIKVSLSMISDALDNGHEFSESSELIPVGISTGDGMFRQFLVAITTRPDGRLEIVVPNANWTGGMFVLIADVNDNRKVWKITHLELGGRSLDDR